MNKAITTILSPRNITIDVLIFVCILFIPALSHVAPFPLYILDPMRILMFTGYLLTRQNVNAFMLAIAIPLFSSLVTGHPPMFKAILISIELMVNLLLFIQLLNRTKLHVALSMFLSILVSKLVYYFMKFVFINSGFIEGDLITTNLWIQLGTGVFVTLVFYLVWMKTGMERKSKVLTKSDT